MTLAETETIVPDLPSDGNDAIQFTIKVFVLKALLEKAAAVLPQRDVIDVLKDFQVEVSHQRIRVAATDLELSIIAESPLVDVQSPGVAVLPGRKLLQIVASAEDGECVLSVSNGACTVRAGHAEWTLRLQSGAEYPDLPEPSADDLHEVNRARFLHALRAVKGAASHETVRTNLMMVDVTNGRMRAADGVRFQQVDFGAFPLSIQIPIGAVDQLVKMLSLTEVETLQVGETDSHLIFRVAGDVFIASKLLADFPDLDAHLLGPAMANEFLLTFDREEMRDAVRRVRINADPETAAVVLRLSNGSVTISARDKMGNRSEETISAGWSEGDRAVVVNHALWLALLDTVESKSAHVLLGKEVKTRPSLILLKDDEAGVLGTLQQMRQDWVDAVQSP